MPAAQPRSSPALQTHQLPRSPKPPWSHWSQYNHHGIANTLKRQARGPLTRIPILGSCPLLPPPHISQTQSATVS